MKRYSFAGEGEYYSVSEVDAIIAEKDKEIYRLNAGWQKANATILALNIGKAERDAKRDKDVRAKALEDVSDELVEDISASELRRMAADIRGV